MEQPNIDIHKQILDSLYDQHRSCYTELERRIVEWSKELAEDEELYVVEKRERPELKENGSCLVDMTITQEISYSPLVVKKGTDIGFMSIPSRFIGEHTLLGPVTKEDVAKWIDEHK